MPELRDASRVQSYADAHDAEGHHRIHVEEVGAEYRGVFECCGSKVTAMVSDYNGIMIAACRLLDRHLRAANDANN